MWRNASALTIALLASTACLDSSRVNRTCTWVDTSTRRLNPSLSADREHLRADAQLAGELGVRLADVRFRSRPDRGDPIQESCTSAMIDTIARRHGLSPERVREAVYYRVWWADLLAVYLPLAVVVALCMDFITRRIRRSFDPEDRGIAFAAVVLFVPVVALLALGVGQTWGFAMEGLFLRNEHIAFRAFVIPIMQHGWIAYSSLFALSGAVAIRRARRTPLQRVAHTHGMRLRHSTSRVSPSRPPDAPSRFT